VGRITRRQRFSMTGRGTGFAPKMFKKNSI
jgi:hypothetical protein